MSTVRQRLAEIETQEKHFLMKEQIFWKLQKGKLGLKT